MKEESEVEGYGHKTVKFPIFVSSEQEELLWEMNRLHANLFSMATAEVQYRMDNKEAILARIDQRLIDENLLDASSKQKDRTLLTKAERVLLNKILYSGKTSFQALCDWATSVRDSLPVFSQLNAWSMQTTLDRVTGSFASYFELKKRGDTEARKPGNRYGHNVFYAVGWKSCMYGNGFITLPHKMSDLVLGFVIPSYQKGVIGDKTIRRIEITREYPEKEISCRFFMSITYEVPIAPTVSIERVLALDLGASNIAGIDSRGKTFLQPMRRADKYWNKKLKPLKERRKILERDSPEYKKLQAMIRTMERRQHNQMKDFQRKLALAVVQSADCIIIGMTPIRLGLSQSNDGTAKEHRGVQNTGTLSRLKLLIANKAKEFGKTVIIVPDAQRVEPIANVHYKILMAAEHFKRGISNVPDWSSNRGEKTAIIVGKSILRIPKRFL